MSKKLLWIFSLVVDNFGDIGVAYRLARELSKNQYYEVFLWTDTLSVLAAIEPGILVQQEKQRIHGVNVVLWRDEFLLQNTIEPAVIVEMFGCFSERPLVLNVKGRPLHLLIEYLSAEQWTLDHHLKPSIGLQQDRFFYFLGFLPQSGGLLIEHDYRSKEAIFKAPSPNPVKTNFLNRYGLTVEAERIVILLFGYATPLWNRWIEAWEEIGLNYELWIAGELACGAINEMNWSLPRVKRAPWVSQADFDGLLWLCGIVIVRGEDSFVRAQLAGIPFFWHIYPQADAIHLKKLQAFLSLLAPFYPLKVFFHYKRLLLELNGGLSLQREQRQASWVFLLTHIGIWKEACQAWREFLFSQPTAYEKLTQFLENPIK